MKAGFEQDSLLDQLASSLGPETLSCSKFMQSHAQACAAPPYRSEAVAKSLGQVSGFELHQSARLLNHRRLDNALPQLPNFCTQRERG